MAFSSLYAAGMQEVSVASSVWKIVISLIVVIAFIPACLWLMKRFQFAQMKLGQSEIKIVNVQSLGTKEKLMLVEVEGERLLIGVTAQSITHLKSFSPSGKSFASIMEEVDREHSTDDKSNGDRL
ncbi:flagellar biosynthetic protein FliO [Marinomonas shanghaiensis]|jgi:flagellar protein FliO/FliZ|uniref:flagellar biosynthetic protein FliO n=1 Tax=Marinomonas shanghaiensis TaxID=2202418 RepID=UPI000DB9F0A6|nr:flagellar biosynthetic protein FliO [Marinomonas shanghaiensis]